MKEGETVYLKSENNKHVEIIYTAMKCVFLCIMQDVTSVSVNSTHRSGER